MALQQFSRSLPMMMYAALDVVMPPFRVIFRDFGLTEQQWRVLRVLWERDRMTLGDLSSATLISPPSLVGVVDRVIALGLIKKTRSVVDRRVVHIAVTRKGRKLEDKVTPRVDAAFTQLRTTLDPKTWDALIRGLETLAAAHGAAAQGRAS